MFGFRKKNNLRSRFNNMLLDDIDLAKKEWDQAQQTQNAVYDADEELIAQTEMARAKYHFLFLEAKRRKIKGHIQSSVIDH